MKIFYFMALLLLPFGVASAATDYYLKLDGVEGEATATTSTTTEVEASRDEQTTGEEPETVAAPTSQPQEGRTDALLEIKGVEGETNSAPGVEPDEIDTRSTAEDSELQSIEPDEIDVAVEGANGLPRMLLIALPSGGLRAGYVKISDIKGEVEEAKKKGNVEYNWKVEEGEKNTTPPGIIVALSKASETAVPKLLKASCASANAVCDPEEVGSNEQLREFVERTANTFSEIREISVSDEAITMQGVIPFKLFWFIPIRISSTIETSMNPDTFARVKVKLPWYRVFGRAAASGQLVTELEQSIADQEVSVETAAEVVADDEGSTSAEPKPKPKPDPAPSEQLSLNYEELKAHIVDAMSRFIAQYNETDLEFLD